LGRGSSLRGGSKATLKCLALPLPRPLGLWFTCPSGHGEINHQAAPYKARCAAGRPPNGGPAVPGPKHSSGQGRNWLGTNKLDPRPGDTRRFFGQKLDLWPIQIDEVRVGLETLVEFLIKCAKRADFATKPSDPIKTRRVSPGLIVTLTKAVSLFSAHFWPKTRTQSAKTGPKSGAATLVTRLTLKTLVEFFKKEQPL